MANVQLTTTAGPVANAPLSADSELWLGCESVHPLTWVPGTAALGFADMSCGRPSRQEGPLWMANPALS